MTRANEDALTDSPSVLRSPADLDPAGYEYVIVGSGPGGGPLAVRLARAGKRVLLIEAGDDHGTAFQYQVPALSLQSTEYEPMMWTYWVNHFSNQTYQATDSKMTYRKPDGSLYTGLNPPAGSTPLGIYYPRSGSLGGCSSHNAMITVYPHRSDWDGIAALTGDSSWSAANMRKYFHRLENCKYLVNGSPGHGFTGWLTTSLTDLTLVVADLKLLRIVLNAVISVGQGGLLTWLITTVTSLTGVLLTDLNNDSPSRDSTLGVYQMPIAVDNGFRSSPRQFMLDTATAVNADGSPTYVLDILLNTLVTKVRFEHPPNATKPRAVGVEYLHGAHLYRADPQSSTAGPGIPGYIAAGTEVILAAGAFNTPQLLMLSGIGPAAELPSEIDVIVDLPGVGKNLQDRYETTVIGKTNSDFAVLKGCTFGRTPDDPCLAKWYAGSNTLTKGVYASNGIALAIVRKSTAAAANEDPDLFVAGAPVAFPGYYPGYADDGTSDWRHWTWLVLKAHTRNRAGTVKLRSLDPRDTPLIDFNNFFDPVDAAKDSKALVEGMKFIRGMLQSVGGFEETWPGSSVNTDAKLDAFVRKEAWGHHASCTCPIGADNDPMAVLDSQFRVRGVDGLRVVDASVFPRIPGFFIALPTYMISEKAADVILGL